MNKLSKLTALLLALLLAIGAPMAAVAEETTVIKTIETLADYLQVADTALYEKIMSFEKYGEYWKIGYLLEDEDIIAYIANNDPVRVKEIQDHLSDMFWAASTSFPGKPGPLVSAVAEEAETVSTYSLRSMTRESTTSTAFEDHAGLELDKSATPNEDGKTYTISLEAYATGTVQSTKKGTPLDIVLVLDISSSMSKTFGDTSRWEALQTAVNSFISTIGSTYDADTMNHRISMVTFHKTVTDTQTWTPVDPAGVTTLQAWINGKSAPTSKTGTDQSSGMSEAETLLGTSYGNPEPTPRQKVVVMFTDGSPSENGTATRAITTANTLKANGVLIYTVAVYPNADPTTTYTTNTIRNDKGGDGDLTSVDLLCHAISSNYVGATATGTGSTSSVTLGTLNSSVSPYSAPYTSYYLTGDSPDDLNNKFKDIATSVTTGSTPIELGTETVLKDVVTKYFTMPANTSAVNVYTVDCVGFNYDADGKPTTPIWATNDDGSEKRVVLPQATSATDAAVTAGTACYVSISGQTIDVKGFDYSKNYVAPAADNHVDPLGKIATGSFMGRKLVVEFVVTTKPGFLGGDTIDTNESTSGIYEVVDGVEIPFEGFEQPKVDIQVPALEILGADQHIYLGNNADLDALLRSFSVTYNIITSTDDEGNIVTKVGEYTVDTILNHYTQLTFTLKDEYGNTVATYTIQAGQKTGTWTYNTVDYPSLQLPFEKDTTFYVSYEAVSSTNANNKSTGKLEATVYVYTPEVTFQDSVEQYMAKVDAVDDYYTNNNIPAADHIVWTHPTYGVAGSEATMSGTEPELTFTYTAGTWQTNGKVTATEDVPVTVTTKVTGTGYKDQPLTGVQVKYIRIKCDECTSIAEVSAKCTAPTADENGATTDINPNFVIHVYDVVGSLTITKQAGDNTTFDPNETFIFTVKGTDANNSDVDMTVTIKGAGSVTINNLLVGDYTVTEDAVWSWRYNCTANGTAGFTTTATVPSANTVEVTFVNTINKTQWIDGHTYAENKFEAYTETNQGGE